MLHLDCVPHLQLVPVPHLNFAPDLEFVPHLDFLPHHSFAPQDDFVNFVPQLDFVAHQNFVPLHLDYVPRMTSLNNFCHTAFILCTIIQIANFMQSGKVWELIPTVILAATLITTKMKKNQFALHNQSLFSTGCPIFLTRFADESNK